MTEPATLASAATWQPSMSTESATTAPAETTEPRPRMLRSTRAPGSTTHPEKTTAGPTTSPSTSLSTLQQHPLAPVHEPGGDERAALPVHVVEVRLEVGRRGPRVEPVAVVGAGEQAPVAHHGGEGLALDRHPAALGDPVEDRGLEHVGPRVDFVGRRLVTRRLLHEGRHPALVVGGHDAEGGRVGHRVEGDRPLGAPLAVEGHEAGQVQVGQDVAVDHDEGLVDAGEGGGEADGAGRVERLGLDGVGQPDSRRPARRGTPP